MKKCLRDLFLIFLTCLILPSYGFTQNSTADKTLSPYFFVQGDPGIDQLPLKDTRVEIAISGVIADVAVVQVYENTGSRPINARYIFPASTRAAVYSMVMRIDDEIIRAKIKEREAAKKEGKSASLLEQNRPNVFSMSVANIIPGDRVEIELRYTELLVPTDGIYEFVFPTVVGPRYSSQPEAKAPPQDLWVKSPYLREGILPQSEFHLNATIQSAVPIQELTCPTHQIIPQWKDITKAELVLADSDVFHSNRDFILRYRLSGDQIASGLMLYQHADENFFLLMAEPPLRVTDAEIPRREYIFVVDVSGSMNGFPLDISKRLLRDLIGHLRPADQFNVILFSGGSQLLSDSSLAANQENVSAAITLIDGQVGGGGTELLAALRRAMELPREENISRTVVVITDGYIAAEPEVIDYIQGHLDQTNVFAFGIGSSVNRYLIEGVARAGMGEPFVVTDPAEGPSVAARFREYIQTPVLSQVRVRVNGFDAYDVEPSHLPDLFAQRPIILFGKWRGPLTGNFEIEGITGRGFYHSRLDVAGVQPDQANRALRYLWARTRIAELSDFGSTQPDADDIQRIISLSLGYNLLTRYTSFIAVREKISNTQGDARDVNQPLPLPLGVSDLAVGGQLHAGDEPPFIWMIVLLLVALAFRIIRV